MTMKHLLESWRSYENKVLAEEKEPLDEISYEYAEEVESWLADNGDQVALPFNKLFDDKLRTVIPLGKAIAPNSEIASLINWFKRNGYELDFKTGLASKEVEDREGNKRLKQMKAGKLLAQAQKYLTKYDKLYGEMNDIVIDLGLETDYRQHEPWRKKRAERMEHLERAERVFPAISRDVTQTVQNHIQFWNKKSQFYRENPEKAFIEYSIILSRAPIDVLRMSDHKNIRSCHSEGSDYFKCARAEAQGHGPIAYAVETRDLEDIDLDDDEIFEDRDRRVGGIEPVARVRLRRFTEKESGFEFAVPEQRTYGTSIPGFVEKVTDWARESQEPVWGDFIDEDSGEIDPEFHGMFYRTGGSYTDTSSSSLFNKMFEDYGANFHGSAPHRGSAEEDFEDGGDEYEQDYERFHEELRDINVAIDDAEYNVSRFRDVGPTGESGFQFSAEIENDEWQEMGDEVSAYWNGSMTFTFIEGEESLPSDWREQQQISDEIQKLIRSEVHSGIMETQIDDVGNTIEVRVEFETYNDEVNTIAYQISSFVEEMESTSEEYNDIKAMIYTHLAKSGYVNPTAATTLTNKLAAGELEFEHFEITHDNEGHYITLKVDDEEIETGVDFPKRVDTYRAPKTTVGPIRNRLLELMREGYGGARGLSATSNNQYGLVQSKQFTRQVLDLLTPEIAAIVKANADQQKLDLQENSSITPQAIEAHLLHGFVLKLREIQQKTPMPGHGRRKDEVPGKTPIYVDVEEMHYSLDDEDEFEIVEPIIAFFVHLDKNIDKLFKAITDVLQTLDVQYGNKTKEGQSQINDIVQMADDVAEFVKEKTGGGVTYGDSRDVSSPKTYREKLLQGLKRANYVLAKLTSPGDQSYISMFTGIETQYPLRINDSERFKKIITMLQRDNAEMHAYWKNLTPEDLDKPLEQEEEPHKPADDRDDGWQPGMPVTESLSSKLTRYLGEQKKYTFRDPTKNPNFKSAVLMPGLGSIIKALARKVKQNPATAAEKLGNIVALGFDDPLEKRATDRYIPNPTHDTGKTTTQFAQKAMTKKTASDRRKKYKHALPKIFKEESLSEKLTKYLDENDKPDYQAAIKKAKEREKITNPEKVKREKKKKTQTKKARETYKRLKKYLEEQSPTQKKTKDATGKISKSYDSGPDAYRWKELFKRKGLDPSKGSEVSKKIGSQLKGVKAVEAPATRGVDSGVARAFYDPKKPKQIQYFKGADPKKSTVRHELGHVVSKLASKEKPVSDLVRGDKSAKKLRTQEPKRYSRGTPSERIGTLEPDAMLPSQLYGGEGGEYEKIFRFQHRPDVKIGRRLDRGLGKVGSRTQARKGYVADELYAPIKNTQWSIQDAAKNNPKKGYMDGNRITPAAVSAICSGEIKVSSKVRNNVRGCNERDPEKRKQIFQGVSDALNRVAKGPQKRQQRKMVAESLSEKLTRFLDENN